MSVVINMLKEFFLSLCRKRNVDLPEIEDILSVYDKKLDNNTTFENKTINNTTFDNTFDYSSTSSSESEPEPEPEPEPFDYSFNSYFDTSSLKVVLNIKNKEKSHRFNIKFIEIYELKCWQNKKFSITLNEVISEIDHSLYSGATHIICNLKSIGGEKFSIPFTIDSHDMFPTEDLDFFEDVEDDRPDKIDLVHMVDGHLVQEDFTKKLRPYCWNNLQVGTGFRGEAWSWLRSLTNDKNACICFWDDEYMFLKMALFYENYNHPVLLGRSSEHASSQDSD